MKYSINIQIDGPRGDVIAKFENPENLAYWQPGFISITPLDGADPRRVQPGDQFGLVYLNQGRKIKMTETIKVFNLPDEFTATYTAPGMAMTVQNLFIDEGEQTRWFSNNEAETSGVMMRIIKLIMPRCFEKQSRIYMENFKALVETGADIRDAK